MIRTGFITFGLVLATSLLGCLKGDSTATGKAPATVAHNDDHDGDHEQAGGHDDEGPFIELGSATFGAWTLTASRDEGELSPGGEAAIDCKVAGETGKISAVRFWIGTEDAKGAIKALAGIENPAEPNKWHSHVEVPRPFSEDYKLWIEVEDSSGAKHASGFALKK